VPASAASPDPLPCVLTPVPTKHSKSISLIDYISVSRSFQVDVQKRVPVVVSTNQPNLSVPWAGPSQAAFHCTGEVWVGPRSQSAEL
jgi:hypothetical protein